MRNELVCVLGFLMVLLSPITVFAQPPPIPADYSGSVTVNGVAAPDGTLVFAKIEDYTSDSVTTSDGSYRYLVVAPPHVSYLGKTIEFWVDLPGDAVPIKAEQTDVFHLGTSHPSFDLTVTTAVAEVEKPTPLPWALISSMIVVIVILIAGVWYWRRRK